MNVFSIEWCEFCSKCSKTININDENILGPEGSNSRQKKSYNLVQVDEKWTKMGQMGHASNENYKKYK